jgi:hypothetical protein
VHPTTVSVARLVTAAAGILVVLGGLFAWALEDEYGAGDAPGGVTEQRPDGVVIVWDVRPREFLEIQPTDDGRWLVLERDPTTEATTVRFEAASEEDAQRFVEQQATVVFSGTQDEVDAWLEQRDAEYENFWIPGLIIAIGVVMIIGPIVQTMRGSTSSEGADEREESAPLA